MPVVVKASETGGTWGTSSKVLRGSVPGWEQYQDAWHLIVDSLGLSEPDSN
jgi:hypothetical protein